MKKNIIAFGLITALGIGGVFAASNTNSFADMNNTNSTNGYENVAGDTQYNQFNYVYKDGKLKAYNEADANQEGAISIASNDLNLGDDVTVKVEDSNDNTYNNTSDNFAFEAKSNINNAQDSVAYNQYNYVYHNGELKAYNETDANKEGAISIASDYLNLGDDVTIKVEDSME